MVARPVDVLVAGGGGFIGGHLVADLLAQGKTVRSVDVKPVEEWYQVHPDAQNEIADLSLRENAFAATEGAGQVFMLAADMGGMGFIENNKALCMLSVLTSTHMLEAAKAHEVERYFYSSSACVYAAEKQTDTAVTALAEADAYPAQPEDGYGWEKLFTERMCRHFNEDYGMTTRVARYHNVYGPEGTWTGGREKAPAAVCRKIATAVITGNHELDIWGDGEQTRSFMYIDDCVKGSQMILASDHLEPINLGSSELVSINQLYSIVEEIAGIKCTRNYQLDAPQGVRGRNSDNTEIQRVFGWEPSIPLADGMARTYAWIYDQVKRDLS
ncbi:NAD-dependent epimerase/dehydratase family protein [Nocardioides humilatus]|uniref:NAD-dependent epimerase/dehydratase family protein n=1 Tax=Nocardioides humilatus TaxID=2607660 RepID=A0A5B1LEU4_9ACTN|nr:NAD-dependent epimerase/dehydratase family protein [Nocardioides humilatus]KAA1419251.1 NAD-dependent epimerase/dehydratase family protein [Nocardioides humilatus]